MTPTAFCQMVENRLGWSPPDGVPWRRYQAEAAKVKRKINTNPDLFTWRNLTLAVEFCAREHLERTPVGVFSYVQPALEAAVEETTDLEDQIMQAVRVELAKGDPDSWVGVLTRAQGRFRVEMLQEWQRSHG
jgi:hypothetical protein